MCFRIFKTTNVETFSKVDRPGGHAEPEESLKLLPETERKVNIELIIANTRQA